MFKAFDGAFASQPLAAALYQNEQLLRDEMRGVLRCEARSGFEGNHKLSLELMIRSYRLFWVTVRIMDSMFPRSELVKLILDIAFHLGIFV